MRRGEGERTPALLAALTASANTMRGMRGRTRKSIGTLLDFFSQRGVILPFGGNLSYSEISMYSVSANYLANIRHADR